MKFCAACQNLLYKREVDGDLFDKCYCCDTLIKSESSCVYRHTPEQADGSAFWMSLGSDVTRDVTLPSIQVVCPACRNDKAVFYTDGNDIVYTCHACKHTWSS